MNHSIHTVPVIRIGSTAAVLIAVGVLGVVLSYVADRTYSVPSFAAIMVLWGLSTALKRSWKAFLVGEVVLLAAFTGSIGAYALSVVWLIFAGLIYSLRFEEPRAGPGQSSVTDLND